MVPCTYVHVNKVLNVSTQVFKSVTVPTAGKIIARVVCSGVYRVSQIFPEL
jgi:hypothetical protein